MHGFYSYRVYNGLVGMSIADKYVGILISTRFCYVLIIKLHTAFNVRFSEWVKRLSVHSVNSQVNGFNIYDNDVRISPFAVISLHDDSSLIFRQHSMLSYLYKNMVYLYNHWVYK